MTTRTYTVIGMTCQHCVSSVAEEVGEVTGVSAVDVDLPAGQMAVTGDLVDEGEVLAAVEEAGYRAVPPA